MRALIIVEFLLELLGSIATFLLFFFQVTVFVLKSVALSDQVLDINLQILRLTFELSVDPQHVYFVKLLRSQLHVLVVQVIELLLQFRELSCKFCLILQVCLHLFFFDFDALLVHALLSVQLVDLVLFLIAELLGLAQLIRQSLNGLLHFSDQILQLLDFLVGELLLSDLRPRIVPLLFNVVLQTLDFVPQFLVLQNLAVQFALNNGLAVTLKRLLLVDPLSLELLLLKLAFEVRDLLPRRVYLLVLLLNLVPELGNLLVEALLV